MLNMKHIDSSPRITTEIEDTRYNSSTARKLVAAVALSGALFGGACAKEVVSTEPTARIQTTMEMPQINNTSSQDPTVYDLSHEEIDSLNAARETLRNSPTDVSFTQFTVNAGETLIQAAGESVANDPTIGLNYLSPLQKNQLTVTANTLSQELGGVIPAGYNAVAYIADFDEDGRKDIIVDRDPKEHPATIN